MDVGAGQPDAAVVDGQHRSMSPAQGGRPHRIGSLFDGACPTAATSDAGRTERLRVHVTVRSSRYSGPTTGRSTREPRAAEKERGRAEVAEPGSVPCGKERTGLAGRDGQFARISPDADGAGLAVDNATVRLARSHVDTGFTERLRVHRPPTAGFVRFNPVPNCARNCTRPLL